MPIDQPSSGPLNAITSRESRGWVKSTGEDEKEVQKMRKLGEGKGKSLTYKLIVHKKQLY